jgi:hypothetical protein
MDIQYPKDIERILSKSVIHFNYPDGQSRVHVDVRDHDLRR